MCMHETMAVKGFRVALASNTTWRKGICCSNIEEFRTKVVSKFTSINSFKKVTAVRTKQEKHIDKEKMAIYLKNMKIFTEDGTEIDDDEYLMEMPAQSLLVISFDKNNMLSNKREELPENVFDRLLTQLRWNNGVNSVYKEVLDFMQRDFEEKWNQMKSSVDLRTQGRTCLSTKTEDPDWFKDLSTNAKTKEEFMFKNCQGRIRGYLAKAEAQVKEAKDLQQPEQQREATELFGQFRSMLKENSYNGHYFDRANESQEKICDSSGMFSCEGKYNLKTCQYTAQEHSINPYASHEARVLFSTWNLDHVVERSRSVVPSIMECLRTRKRKKHCQLNKDYFYSLLFTRYNLKLVHVVCHDKQGHTAMTCDEEKYWITSTTSRGIQR